MSILTLFKSLTSTPTRRQPIRRRLRASRLSLDALEDRSVPTSVVVLGDLNGDRVTFRSSLGDLSGKIDFRAGPDSVHIVWSFNLSDPSFNGTNFSVSVAKSKTGDGRAIVGHIDAGSNNLGAVKLAADLGDIDAGNGSATVPAIKSLTVDSFGRFGQRGDGNSWAQVNGDVGALVVKHDFIESNFYVTGNLNAMSVGGSVIGGDVAGDGQIYATGNLGKVAIKQDIRGGNGLYTGVVGAGHDVASVTVGGSIYGGNGNNSGNVFAANVQDGKIDLVRVNGSVIGGQGVSSGVIGGAGGNHAISLGTVVIGKDIIGGGGDASGLVYSHFGTLDRLTVKGSLIGGSGLVSGMIGADQKTERIIIRGSLYGGSGSYSGRIYGGAGIDFLNIRGDVRGGYGGNSGNVYYLTGITTQIIGGAVIPGTGVDSGKVTG
jgi:hypothetical protein